MGEIAQINQPQLGKDVSLESLLDEMSKYGWPYIHCSNIDGTWHAKIKMFVSSEGVTFEAKSDFEHKTPKEACYQCYQRAIQSIKDLTK